MPTLELQGKSIRLHRYPRTVSETLRPWDAADEYLLMHLQQEGIPVPEGTVLLVNDAFGALAVALADHRPTTWNDSHLGRLALEHNLVLNGRDPTGVTFVPGDRTPPGPVTLVLLKLPKALAQLEDVLLRLRRILVPGAVVVAGGMIKHTPARAYGLMEDIIGPTRTGLGWKKARLATAVFAAAGDRPPGVPPAEYRLEEFGWVLVSGPNVFSRDHLDLGTRLFLEHLPEYDHPLQAADLGCGNGVLALALAMACPAASILGIDESYQAVASARENLERTGLTDRNIRFDAGDGLESIDPASHDLVVCNPPFHQARTVGDHLAWRMFEQAHRALRPGGELRIVGNRHLGYHLKLQRLFGNCRTVAANRRFTVLSATRSAAHR